MEDALTPTHRQVPDKPTVDGLEERWMDQWDKEKIYRFNRHAAPDRVGVTAHRTRLQLHAPRRRGAVLAHARQGRLLSDGLGRQRPTDRTTGGELLRRSLRPGASLRPQVPATGKAGQEQSLDLSKELRRTVRRTDRHRRSRLQESLARYRCECRLGLRVFDDLQRGPDREPARVPPDAHPRRGLLGRSADALGYRLS